MYTIGEEEAEAARRVILSKNVFRYNTGANETTSLENELCEAFEAKHAIVMNRGTSALISALAALGIGPGHEVIVPGYTFMATATAVVAVGAIPVIAEIDETLTIDVADVAQKISDRTRAVIPVHISGIPCDMDALMELTGSRGISVVEDACQADGGHYRGRRLGSIGEIGTLSFNHFKIMTAGEGGALITNDKALYDRAFVYHDSGISFRPYSKELTTPIYLGMNFRANEITSAILRVQLKRLDGMLASMRAQKRRLIAAIPVSRFVAPSPSNDAEGDCGTSLTLLCSSGDAAKALVEAIDSAGFGAMQLIDSQRHVYANWDAVLLHRGAHHPDRDPFHLPQNAECRKDYSKDMCPRTLDILERTVVVPTHPEDSEEVVERKVSALQQAVDRIGVQPSATR